ncbi:MAG TPA: hypothetical protein VF145_12725 [Chitinophagaceae bacterium]
MLTPEQEKFVAYWEKNREKEKKTLRQLVIGLPAGLTFAVAIVALLVSGWYERANMVAFSSSSPYVFLAAIVIIVSFIAIFTRRHRWEMNEQQYLELKSRQKSESGDAAQAEAGSATTSATNKTT